MDPELQVSYPLKRGDWVAKHDKGILVTPTRKKLGPYSHHMIVMGPNFGGWGYQNP